MNKLLRISGRVGGNTPNLFTAFISGLGKDNGGGGVRSEAFIFNFTSFCFSFLVLEKKLA